MDFRDSTLERWRGWALAMYSQAMDSNEALTAHEDNSLAQAASSYLRSARHQPVKWHAWGKAAFERAQYMKALTSYALPRT